MFLSIPIFAMILSINRIFRYTTNRLFFNRLRGKRYTQLTTSILYCNHKVNGCFAIKCEGVLYICFGAFLLGFVPYTIWYLTMLCTAQLPGPVLKAFGWVQISPFQMAYKCPMITDQLTAGGSVSQLSPLAKLSPWLTLSTKDITTSFWHYKKLFCFLSNQIMGLYHFSNPIE